MVFSKSYCPYCTEVKEKLQVYGTSKVVELDLIGAEGSEMQKSLQALTSQSTVPNVFINGIHVGGCDDTTRKIRDGTLQRLLDAGFKK